MTKLVVTTMKMSNRIPLLMLMVCQTLALVAQDTLSVDMQPDPEDEDYVQKILERDPVNVADRSRNSMHYVLENRYRGFNDEYVERHWYDHTFLELGAGMEQILPGEGGYSFHPMTTYRVAVGKMFTPWHTARMATQLANGYQKTYEHRYYKVALKADYLFNLTAFSKGYDPARPLEVQFLAGLGVQYSKAYGKAAVWTPEAHLGMQVKVCAGPYGSMALEPYVVMTSRRTDGSGENWRNFDALWGVSINFAHKLAGRLTARQRNDSLTRKRMYAPWFIQYGSGLVFQIGEGSSAMGQHTSLTMGKWFAPAVGMRASLMYGGHVSDETVTDAVPGKYRPEYTRQFYTDFSRLRIEAMINPFGFSRSFRWNVPVGMYLVGGLGYGWVLRQYSDRQWLRTISESYSAGLHLYASLGGRLRIYMEPQFVYDVYKIPYYNAKRERVFNENKVTLSLGMTALIGDVPGEKTAAGNMDDDRKWFVGVAFALPLTLRQGNAYTNERGSDYGVRFWGKYDFREGLFARMTMEYLSLSDARITSYYDCVTQKETEIRRSRTGMMTHDYGLLIITAGAGMDIMRMFAQAGCRKRFGMELAGGAGIASLLSHKAVLYSGEMLLQGHTAVAKKNNGGSIHFAMTGSMKLHYRLSGLMGVFVEPQVYLIHGLYRKTYINLLGMGKLQVMQSIALGAEFRL